MKMQEDSGVGSGLCKLFQLMEGERVASKRTGWGICKVGWVSRQRGEGGKGPVPQKLGEG